MEIVTFRGKSQSKRPQGEHLGCTVSVSIPFLMMVDVTSGIWYFLMDIEGMDFVSVRREESEFKSSRRAFGVKSVCVGYFFQG